MSVIFIDPADLPQDIYGLFQVLFLGAVYGYVLFSASNMISDGSELLLLVPSVAGVVGSIVLPILGAVPDGMIVLFSGMGPNAQEQLSVGVGALAGSTIMLLTIPWALTIFAGRVNLDHEGHGSYKRPKSAPEEWRKLTPPHYMNLWRTGVVLLDEIQINAKTMVATCLTYLVLQIPAFQYTGTMQRDAEANRDQVTKAEHPFAFITFAICTIAVGMYMYWNMKQSKSSKVASEIKGEIAVEAIRQDHASLSGLLAMEAARLHDHIPTHTSPINARAQTKSLEDIMRPFFAKYDTNHDKRMDMDELQLFFMDMNERLTREELEVWMKNADKDQSGFIEFTELVEATKQYLIAKYKAEQDGKDFKMKHIHIKVPEAPAHSNLQPEDIEENEEEEEIPQDLAHLSIHEQQRRIKMRAAYLMLIGTLLVLIFSDPMVDVLSNIGTRTGIPAFYVSFVVAPLASNASELIAAYNYAKKKTSKTASIAVSALLGAACMNNTFCLGIFAALMFFKSGGLVWQFTAETCAILFVEICMAFIAVRKTQRLMDALLVLLLYPTSIAMVVVLQGVFGLD